MPPVEKGATPFEISEAIGARVVRDSWRLLNLPVLSVACQLIRKSPTIVERGLPDRKRLFLTLPPSFRSLSSESTEAGFC